MTAAKESSPAAERIVSALSGDLFSYDKDDFVTGLRCDAEWDIGQYERIMEKIRELAPVFAELPEPVRQLLELYIQLPYQMEAFIEHSPEAEQETFYDRYSDTVELLAEVTGV